MKLDRRARVGPARVAVYRMQAKTYTALALRRMRARAFVRDLYALCERHGAALDGGGRFAYEHWFQLSIRGLDVGAIEVDPTTGAASYTF